MSTKDIKVYADITLLVGYAFVNIPQSTGVPFHEWASILFIAPILVHLLLSWKWVVSVTRGMFGALQGKVRFNHTLDLIIFILMSLVMMTGLVISESALPALGLQPVIDPFWSKMHDVTANLTILVVGVHLAMHWDWIRGAVKWRQFSVPLKVLRGSLGPVVIVIAAALVVSFLAWWVGQTEWANQIRQEAITATTTGPEEAGPTGIGRISSL